MPAARRKDQHNAPSDFRKMESRNVVDYFYLFRADRAVLAHHRANVECRLHTCLLHIAHFKIPQIGEPWVQFSPRAQNSLTADLRRNSLNDGPLPAWISATLWFGVGQVCWFWVMRLVDLIHGRKIKSGVY
jgi:hypothetical protein